MPNESAAPQGVATPEEVPDGNEISAPAVAEAAVAELLAVFADVAPQADDVRNAAEPLDGNSRTAASSESALPAESPSAARSTSRPAPRNASAKRTPTKRPALTLASNVSGDFAITAPPGAPNPSAVHSESTPAPADATPIEGETTAAASNASVPPLPSLSPEDAALKFETMPEAPEQRSVVEGQEEVRFVWSRRWPFLTIVPASQVAARSATRQQDSVPAAPEDAADVSLPDATASEPIEQVAEPDVRDEAPKPEIEPPAVTLAAEPLFVEPAVAEPVFLEPAAVEAATVETPDVEADVEAEEEPGVTAVSDLVDEIAAGNAAAGDPIVSQRIDPSTSPVVLRITGLSRRFGDTIAVNGIDLDVHEGSFYGIVGPNGAGKTTTLSMVTGLLRPDTGSITVHGVDVWKEPGVAKRSIGVLPDRLRLFDRLTGAQLLYYSGVLRGLDGATVRARTKDLARAFGLEDALNRLVTDYSAGMTKKVALAAAMIHSPRLLVLDEPFESVDPVSAANVIEILQRYVAHGGTVVLSSHGMDLIQRVCDHVAIIVHGKVLAAGAVEDVRGSGTLEERFVELAGGRKAAEGMEWLHSFSD
ncbi:MAG: ATP-binding cassette domain-containing protein [Mycetocola sp.]